MSLDGGVSAVINASVSIVDRPRGAHRKFSLELWPNVRRLHIKLHYIREVFVENVIKSYEIFEHNILSRYFC